MKVAYLFIEKYPNYDLTFKTLDCIDSDDLVDLETYTSVGLMSMNWLNGNDSLDKQKFDALRLFASMKGIGHMAKNNADEAILSQPIYVVIFDSIRRDLAQKINLRLKEIPHYLGFTQVVPDYPLHSVTFIINAPPVEFRIQGKRVFILYSSSGSDDSENVANEKLKYFQRKYTLGLTAAKTDIGAKFSFFDGGCDSIKGDLDIQTAILLLGDEWGVQAEKAIYALRDSIPEALDDLILGIKELSKPNLSSAWCAKAAVNFRRCLDKIAETLEPTLSSSEKAATKGMGDYKSRLKIFVDKKLSQSEPYRDYVKTELDEISTRISKLYNLSNKGIHEDWFRKAFSMLVLRLVLLINDLLTTFPGKQKIIYDESHFEFI